MEEGQGDDVFLYWVRHPRARVVGPTEPKPSETEDAT
jgi:hypothetical protein